MFNTPRRAAQFGLGAAILFFIVCATVLVGGSFESQAASTPGLSPSLAASHVVSR